MIEVPVTSSRVQEDGPAAAVRAINAALEDPRAKRTSDALTNAFLALLERKPYEHITIRDITDEAQVHRATFFRHHTTKEALLDYIAASQIEEMVALTLPALDSGDAYTSLLQACDYVEQHWTLWSTLLTGGAASTMREQWLRVSKEVARGRATDEHWIPVALGVNFSNNIMFETMAWWLSEPKDTISGTRVAGILHHMLNAVQTGPAHTAE